MRGGVSFLIKLNGKPAFLFTLTKIEGHKTATYIHEDSSPYGYYRGKFCYFPKIVNIVTL